jgi:hypothetical protein
MQVVTCIEAIRHRPSAKLLEAEGAVPLFEADG